MVINERDFFKHPFTRDEIRDLLKGRSASEMFNFGGPSFESLGLSGENPGGDELVYLMPKEPGLIRRPIVHIGGNVYFNADRSALENLLS